MIKIKGLFLVLLCVTFMVSGFLGGLAIQEIPLVLTTETITHCNDSILGRFRKSVIPSKGQISIHNMDELGPLIFVIMYGTAEKPTDLRWEWRLKERGTQGCVAELWVNYHGIQTLGPTYFIDLDKQEFVPEGPRASEVWGIFVDTWFIPLDNQS